MPSFANVGIEQRTAAPLPRMVIQRQPAPHPGPLPAPTRVRMEGAFGRQFNDVTVHQDSPRAGGSVHALTEGRTIHFAPDRFRPDTPQGDWLIGHELAHVVQQTDGGQAAPQAFNPAERSNALEAEADRAATEAAQGRPAAIRMRAPTGTTQAFDVSEQADESPTPEAEKPVASPAPRAKKPAISSAPKADEPAASAEPAGITDIESDPAAGGGDAGSASGASGADAALLLPEAPAALSAAARRRLAIVKANAKAAGQATTALPTAEKSTAQARAAVEEPQAEQDARAEAGVVEQLDERPAPSATIEQACRRIRKIIKGKRPADEDSLVDAEPRKMAKQAGGQVNKQVESRAGAVSDGYDALAGEPAGQPSRAPVPAKAPPEKVALPDMNAASGAPDALGEQDVSLDADVAQQQQGIDAAGMNTEPAKLVEDGPIAEARAAMGDLEAEAQTGPQAVLAEQTAAIAQAKGDMGALQEKAARALADARSGTVSNVKGLSVDTTASEEQQRAQVGVQMQAIFAGAQTQVDELLAPLSDKALRRWDSGVKRLAGEFESSLAQVKAKIAKRYEVETDYSSVESSVKSVGSWLGAKKRQVTDSLIGLPDWVTLEYDEAEKAFADGCCALARDISRDVNQVIESCEKIIEQARTDIDQHVASLPDELKKWATGEATKIGKKLASLQSKVGETRQSLDQDLVDRANQAVQEVRERVQELREAAKGVVGRIADALDEFLENPGRAIVNGLLKVVGIPPVRFWALVDKLGDVVAGIAADPMGFANNLMKGVGQGFQQFFDNFPRHLLQGVMDWLFSRLGEAGVRMPIDFTLPSVITLFLEVMGITWARIRKLLAKHAGEDNVALIEQAMGLIVPLIEQGPQGIFEMIKEQLEPKVILDAVIESVIDYLTTALITQVMPKIIAMLNPAGAILKAIEAIWKTISWLFENAAKLFTLVEAVVNGAADLLSGNVSGMANAVEFALAGLLGPVIGFLADIIGLSGVPEAVKDAILGLQERVEKILDKVIGFLVDKGRTLLKTLTGRGKKDGATGGDTELGEKVSFRADAETHHLWVERKGASATLMVASDTPMPVETRLEHWNTKLATLPDQPDDEGVVPRKRGASLLTQADRLHHPAEAEAKRLAEEWSKTSKIPESDKQIVPPSDDALEAQENELGSVLRQLFELFGEAQGESPAERFAADLALAHPKAQPLLHEALTEEKDEFTKVRTWADAKKRFETASATKDLISKPLLKSHGFGSEAHDAQAIPAVTRAITELQSTEPQGKESERSFRSPDEVATDYKAQLHEGNGTFKRSKQALVAQIFAASRQSKATKILYQEYKDKLETADSGEDLSWLNTEAIRKELQKQAGREYKNGADKWVAVFATSGAKLYSTGGTGQQKPITLRKLLPIASESYVRAQATIRESYTRTMMKAEGVSADSSEYTRIIKQAVKMAKKLLVDKRIFDQELALVRNTGIPRLVQSGPHVINNTKFPEAKRNSLYQEQAKHLEREADAKLAGQVHHVVPLYLGGSHMTANLMTAEGKATVQESAHWLMHQLVDSHDIAFYLEGSQERHETSLKYSDLVAAIPEDTIRILIGTLYADGQIKYRQTNLRPERKKVDGGGD